MIEINLLPERLRKRKKLRSLDLSLPLDKLMMWSGIGVIGIMVLIVLVFFTGTLLRGHQISRLVHKEKKFAARFLQIESVNKEMAVVKAKMKALDELTKRKFLWAEKLNQLSDLALPGIWFTAVYTDSEHSLIIEGSVVSKAEEEMASVGKFMKNLREDEQFFKDFKNIKLESVERSSNENRDIVEFKIALYFE